jgi:DUF4097 and DUF4098 domain-containing protein YvlB
MPSTTYPLTGPIELAVRIGRGSLTVHERDDVTEATVTIEPLSPGSDLIDRSLIELRGSTLVVALPRQGGIFDLPIFGQRNRDAADVVVTVPSGTQLKVTSFTAPITVDGRCGNADIAAGSASIDLDDVDGDLRVRLGSGSARARRITRTVEARSGSGDIDLGEVGGALTTACGSGHLEVAVAHGPVRFRSGSGGANLAAVHADVDVASGSGGLAIGLPSGRPARLDVTTGSGRVASDLPIENAPSTTGTPITIRARTGSGEVRLFRAA